MLIKAIKVKFLFRLLKKIRRHIIEQENIINIEKLYNCNVSYNANLNIDDISNIHISEKVYIGAFTTIHIQNQKNRNNSFLSIGEGTYIGESNNIRASGGKIFIGKKCLISQQVSIISTNHSAKLGTYIMDQKWSEKDNYVNIADDVWIGCGAVILPGVSIGNGAIIGASSVVTKNIPENAIAYGNPVEVKAVRVP